MRILISGATGFLGSALVPQLEAEGHEVWALSRRPGERTLVWDPEAGKLDAAQITGFDGVVHLAGENIAGRWTEEKLRKIRTSRVQGTKLLADACAQSAEPPGVFVMASAVGIYGNRGEEELTEESPPGTGILAEFGQAWEAAAGPVEAVDGAKTAGGLDAVGGVRVVKLRFGVVLSPEGGALKLMLPAFRLGGGGRLGSGRQWMAWITRRDAVAILHRAMTDSSMQGVYNAMAPGAVRNAEFTRVLAGALRRPAIVPVPAFALRLVFGRMADEALLTSQHAVPTRLMQEGYRFQDPELAPALKGMLSVE